MFLSVIVKKMECPKAVPIYDTKLGTACLDMTFKLYHRTTRITLIELFFLWGIVK